MGKHAYVLRLIWNLKHFVKALPLILKKCRDFTACIQTVDFFSTPDSKYFKDQNGEDPEGWGRITPFISHWGAQTGPESHISRTGISRGTS